MKLKLKDYLRNRLAGLKHLPDEPVSSSSCSVIVCLRIAVVPKDRLTIIPSLPHRIRVAGCND
ncbi:hypothetical protein CLG94_01065 [Candidatus Methylomirabilis limnetica]|uniref:Uncharacterized protein n=1 Tax=Candidatus Methylomirabilis limnetica TaxID=2033718 RepID=A0A2T4U1C3_9BACT|nr:hypothetical protein CLG94_01065 [Candidatus Methylomirabilis limnetica]